MSQYSTLYTLSASSIACNDTSDDGDDRGSSGDSTTGGSEGGSSTGCYTGVWWHVYLYGIASILETFVCSGRHVSVVATYSSE